MDKDNYKLIRKAIGLVIEKYRKDMNLNQSQLAVLVYGKEAQLTVSKSELGKRNIPTHEIMKYIQAFRVTPKEFFNKINNEISRLSK